MQESRDTFDLSGEESLLLTEYDATIHDLQQQQVGMLKAIVRREKLKGNWQRVGNKLLRTPDPKAVK